MLDFERLDDLASAGDHSADGKGKGQSHAETHPHDGKECYVDFFHVFSLHLSLLENTSVDLHSDHCGDLR